MYKIFVDNLVCFIVSSQEELDKVSYQTSQLNYHRYFILLGFEATKNSRFTLDTDSFIEIKNKSENNNFIKKLILCYSMPNYENIAVYTSNNVISLNDLQQLFHSLMNGTHTKKDYLFSISRADFVFNESDSAPSVTESDNYSDIITRAMNNEMISYDEFKIAMKELLPEKNLIMDESCVYMPFELQNIILEHNKNNFLTKLNVYYNKIKEHDECIMLFDLPTNINKYSMQIKSIEGFELYMNL